MIEETIKSPSEYPRMPKPSRSDSISPRNRWQYMNTPRAPVRIQSYPTDVHTLKVVKRFQNEPEAGGSWFVLCVEPTPMILSKLDVVDASAAFDGDLIQALQNDGCTPFCDDDGNWIARTQREDVGPSYIPHSTEHIVKFVTAGTMVTLDDGCWPALVRFSSVSCCDGTRVDDLKIFSVVRIQTTLALP